MSEVSGNDRVTEIRYSVEPAEVITVPIDATLSVEGQAADAKAVGDAIQDVRDDIHIQVNDEEADAQGKVIITGSGIAVSTTDSTTIAAKVTAMDAKRDRRDADQREADRTGRENRRGHPGERRG